MRTLHLSFLLMAAALLAPAADYFMYVGTYTGPQSKGIYVYRFQTSTGEVTSLGLAGEASNPSFLAVHPSGDYIYSADETRSGSVTAFKVDRKTGKLTKLNSASARGGGPCALSVDETGKYVMVANYGSGSVAVIQIKPDGSLGESTGFDQQKGSGPDPRQKGPHAHSAVFAPGNKFALSCNLGTDKVYVYRFDAKNGSLTANAPAYADLPPGSGPRHITFHPNGKYAYVVNELTSTVTTFAWDGSAGTLKLLSTISALPKGFNQAISDGAEIQVHPSGKFVFSSNRDQANNLAAFRVDAKGMLTLEGNTPSGGLHPRYFGFDPSGNWLLAANQDSNNIVPFRVDGKTGKLTPSGKPIELFQPVCVMFIAPK